MKDQFSSQMDDNLDPEEAEKMVLNQVLTQDINKLTCDSYTQAMIEEDDQITSECYDGANEEAHRAEEEQRMALIFQQQAMFDEERKKLEQEYGQKFNNMRQSEYRKIEELKVHQENLINDLKQKEQSFLKIEEEKKKQEFQLIQLEDV